MSDFRILGKGYWTVLPHANVSASYEYKLWILWKTCFNITSDSSYWRPCTRHFTKMPILSDLFKQHSDKLLLSTNAVATPLWHYCLTPPVMVSILNSGTKYTLCHPKVAYWGHEVKAPQIVNYWPDFDLGIPQFLSLSSKWVVRLRLWLLYPPTYQTEAVLNMVINTSTVVCTL
jgi:hypothetical protein